MQLMESVDGLSYMQSTDDCINNVLTLDAVVYGKPYHVELKYSELELVREPISYLYNKKVSPPPDPHPFQKEKDPRFNRSSMNFEFTRSDINE